MKLIYLHLYKDTYLIFMQAFKLLQYFLNQSKFFIKKKNMYFSKLKVFTISKLELKNRAKQRK